MGEIVIATVSMHVVYDKEKNLETYFKYIDEAADKGAKLIVFPETSLQGYLDNLGVFKKSTVIYQHENAETVPEGASTQALIRKAKEKDIYIIYGMTEKDQNQVGVLYNTAVLVGPEGYIGKYRKVHLPMDEAHVFYPGKEINVFDTGIGKIGMLICYDKNYPEVARILAAKGAELIVMPTAWSLDENGADPETNYSVYAYDLLDKVRAMENQAIFISSNQIGATGDIDFFGRSRIVSPLGVVLSEILYEEGIATYRMDVKKEVQNARTVGLFGLNLMKDRRPELYHEIAEY